MKISSEFGDNPGWSPGPLMSEHGPYLFSFSINFTLYGTVLPVFIVTVCEFHKNGPSLLKPRIVLEYLFFNRQKSHLQRQVLYSYEDYIVQLY